MKLGAAMQRIGGNERSVAIRMGEKLIEGFSPPPVLLLNCRKLELGFLSALSSWGTELKGSLSWGT